MACLKIVIIFYREVYMDIKNKKLLGVLALLITLGVLTPVWAGGRMDRKSKWLFDAVANNDLSRVETLFKQFPKLNDTTDLNGYTPLHRAMLLKSPEMGKLLIAHGADINAENKQKLRPIHMAIKATGTNLDMLKFLVTNKACNINATDNNGETALHHAVTYGDDKAAKLLVEHGALKNIKNVNGQTPLDIAKEKDNKELIAYLKQ